MSFYLFLSLEILNVLNGITTVYLDFPAFRHLIHINRHFFLCPYIKEIIHITIARIILLHLVQHIVQISLQPFDEPSISLHHDMPEKMMQGFLVEEGIEGFYDVLDLILVIEEVVYLQVFEESESAVHIVLVESVDATR